MLLCYFSSWRFTASTRGSACLWTVSRCSISITASSRWCPSTPSRSTAAWASPNWTELETISRSRQPDSVCLQHGAEPHLCFIRPNKNVSANTEMDHETIFSLNSTWKDWNFQCPLIVWTFEVVAVNMNRLHTPAQVTVVNLAIFFL